MTDDIFDRDSANLAKAVMSSLCSVEEQQIVLEQLLGSIAVADAHAPSAWAVTLFDNGFRMNVGIVEVFTFFDGTVRLLLLGTVPEEIQTFGDFIPTNFLSITGMQNCFFGSIAEFKAFSQTLQSPHYQFIEAASLTSKGIARKGTRYKSSHSTGLVVYAKSIARNALSQNEGASTGFVLPNEVHESQKFIEGAVQQITVNAYERSAEARAACIKAHGAKCSVCNFDFGAVYGSSAQGFIHVHHLKALATIGEQYEVNPIEDLRPVCPNCHAVIHMTNPARTIEEAQALLAPNT